MGDGIFQLVRLPSGGYIDLREFQRFEFFSNANDCNAVNGGRVFYYRESEPVTLNGPDASAVADHLNNEWVRQENLDTGEIADMEG